MIPKIGDRVICVRPANSMCESMRGKTYIIRDIESYCFYFEGINGSFTKEQYDLCNTHYNPESPLGLILNIKEVKK